MMQFNESNILKAIFSSFPGYIYISSRDYRIQYMNQRLIERTGYDATGELCYRALHGLDNECAHCMNDRVFHGETVEYETTSPRDSRMFRMTSTPVSNMDGTISKLTLIIDMTEYHDALEELYRERERSRTITEGQTVLWEEHHQLELQVEEKTAGLSQVIQWLDENIRQKEAASSKVEVLSQVLDASPAAIVIINAGGIIEYVNDRYSQITGFMKNVIIGQTLMDCLETTMGELQGVRERLVTDKQWDGVLEFRASEGPGFEMKTRVNTVTVKNQNKPETYYIITSI